MCYSCRAALGVGLCRTVIGDEAKPWQTVVPRRVLRGWNHEAFLHARCRSGLSREDAARRAGVGVATLQHWETGRHFPQIDILRKVLSVIDADIEDIIDVPPGERFPSDLRVFKQMTQPELALHAKITTSSLREIERAARTLTPQNAVKISRVLGVSVDEYTAAFQRCRNRPPGTPS